MPTGLLANFRWQTRPVLVRTELTSSHTLTYLLHLLTVLAIALAHMAEDSNPLGSRRSPTVDMLELSSLFTRGSER